MTCIPNPIPFLRRISRGSLAVSLAAMVLASGTIVSLASFRAFAADPLLPWDSVRQACEAPKPSTAGRIGNLEVGAARQAGSSVVGLHDRAAPLPATVSSLPYLLHSKPADAASEPPAGRGLSNSLVGLSSTFVPAVTGDLYGSRPATVSRATVAQASGVASGLRLYRSPVGAVAVGSSKPSYVGEKK